MSKSNKSAKKAHGTKESTKAAAAKSAPKTSSVKDAKQVGSKARVDKDAARPLTSSTAAGAPTTKVGKATPASATTKRTATLPVTQEVTAPEARKETPASANSRARAVVLDEADSKRAIAALQKFGSTQLQRVFGDLFGAETTSRNVMYLRSAISKGLLDRAAGIPFAAPAEEKKAARNKVVTEPKPKEPRPRDPRLPAVGTTIERLYKGEALRVKVLEEGFHFKGTTYPSLSALAKSLTGCSTNGFLFFQLIERPAKA